MIDSFGFSSKHNDTLFINSQISDEEFKDILFTVHCFSKEYGGDGFLIKGINNGESIFDRIFQVKDSIIFLGKHKIDPGATYEDILRNKPLNNIFKVETNKLIIKNEGFIKVILMSNFSSEEQTILLKNPALLVSGKSYDSYYINKSLMAFYRTLPYILIILGFTFYLLSLILHIKNKKNHNH